MRNYKLVVVGGTFDRLHAGHKSLIRSSLQQSENLIIGLTSDEYVKTTKMVADFLPFSVRKKDLEDFLSEIGFLENVEIKKINSNEIPDSLQGKIEAIVVTSNTLKGAEQLNSIRKTKNLNPLPIVIFPLVKDKNEKVISSTRIRSGEIDQDKEPKLSNKMPGDSLVLTPFLREQLKKPLGKLIENDSEIPEFIGSNFITVGDITTKKFIDLQLRPTVSVVDFMVERKHRFTKINELGFSGKERVYCVDNPASKITNEVFMILSHVLRWSGEKTSVIKIVGEEDLAVLPAILTAPLGYSVFYGQPKEGLVCVPVNDDTKRIAKSILSQFRVIK